MTLTGKRRYREQRRWFRRSLLVLQVQYRDVVFGRFGGEPVTLWRDATVSDLELIKAEYRPFPLEGVNV